MIPIVWVTHPRHMPKAPKGRVVVVDVAFAAARQYKSKTLPFIEALGPRLVRWIDHHEHKEGWAPFLDDPRFILVPNRVAHACPELITPAVIEQASADVGAADVVVAHCDFDGLVAAVKWRVGGTEVWPGADEDARAVDSPGRGHALTSRGERLALAMDEATATYGREQRKDLMTRVADACTRGEEDLGLAEELDTLSSRAGNAEEEAERVAEARGELEAPGVYVVRVDHPPDNRMRRNLLLAAERRARIGAIYEPDKEGGHWLIAATFDEAVDLEQVEGFEGGRSDYRFARAHGKGEAQVRALGAYLQSLEATGLTPPLG